MLKRAVLSSFVLAVAAALPNAHASLVLLGSGVFESSGLGAANTVLTLQNPTGGTTEFGSVGLNSSGVQVISGNALTGSSQTQVRSLASLGISSANDLRIVMNAQEPNTAAANSIIISDLALTLYSPTGAVLFDSGLFEAANLPTTFPDMPTAGFVFGLDPVQTAQAQSAGFASANFGQNVIGLSAFALNATGGPETFFATSGATLNQIPEPTSALLLGAGLLAGLTLVRTGRRKR